MSIVFAFEVFNGSIIRLVKINAIPDKEKKVETIDVFNVTFGFHACFILL